MSWKLMRSVVLSVLAVVLPSLSSGCAEERDPINRVQANALDKSFFVGADIINPGDDPEFWTQATLNDVGYGAAQDGLFTSTYTQSVSRIKWHITEDLLLARLTYERIQNSDGKGAGAATNDGQVVAAYTILSHFDIRHDYNPSTGEELNVIVENTTDRPWYERQYFRVDWAKNLNTDAYDFDTLSLLGAFGSITYEPLAYYVNDPDDADAPHFDVDSGYFDVTNKAFATPDTIDLSHFGWGIDKLPACWFDGDFMGGSFPAGNCNATEITIRQAFRRVIDTDYEPVDWDGYRFQSYGGFYLERYGYARNFGMSDDKWHRFLTRYNIWQRSHYYDDPVSMTGDVPCYTPDTLAHGENPHADADNDGTEDRCWEVTVRLAALTGACTADEIAVNAPECYTRANPSIGGSRCDTFKQRCTLPYRAREVRSLQWYYTNDSALEYFDGTEWATHEHDVAMRHAVQVARYAECMATNKPIASMPERRAQCLSGDGLLLQANPVYFGQMDDHQEVRELAKEVDDCRHGLSYNGSRGEDYGPINSAEREDRCVALADTVVAARAGSRTIDPAIVLLAKMPEQIVLCHSPVEATDPATCAPAEERLPAGVTAQDCQLARDNRDVAMMDTCAQARNVRRGDLRYHLVNVIREPQTPSPWGIYTDAEDPLTGEKVSAAVNVWSHINDLFSQTMVDRIRYIKGELSTEDLTEGTYVRDWAIASDAASGHGIAPKITRADLDAKIAAFAKVDVEEMKNTAPNATVVRALRDAREELRNTVLASVDAPSNMAPIYEARRKRVMGTETEAQLVTPMMQQFAGVEGLPADAVIEAASIFRSVNPMVQKQIRLLHEQALAERGSCILYEAPAPVALTGLANVLERKFKNICADTDPTTGQCVRYFGRFGSNGCDDPSGDGCVVAAKADRDFQYRRSEAMRKYLAQRAHHSVISHEMGHSIGERHNFVSSSDAYLYRPQYWQVRTDDGNEATEDNRCADYDETGGCLGPRYFDPVTQHENDQLIWMWMQSSMMDYPGEYTQDMIGLGVYDVSSHRMFYGENVAVYQDDTFRVGQPRAKGMLSKMDSFGGILGIQPVKGTDTGNEDIHYSRIQEEYKVITNCQPVDVAAYQPASWDQSAQGAWDPLLDGLIVQNRSGQYTRCEQPKVDYMHWQSLRFPTDAELDSSGLNPEFWRGGPAVDSDSRVRVPYGFATDSWADVGNASVYRHDNGADVYEIFNFLATSGEVYHVFDNYRRRRAGFSVKNAALRTLGRYHEKIRDGAKGLGLLANWYRDKWADSGAAFTGLWGYAARAFFPDNVLASGMVFDHFTLTLARPEIGAHYFDTFDGVLRSNEDSTLLFGAENKVNIPNGATGYFGNISSAGKLVENRLSENHGEFDREYTINSGSYYDKVWSPYLMTESVDNFISDSRGDFVDGRYRAVSLADLFPDGYRRWLANNLTGDDFIKGPRIATNSGGEVLLDENRYPSMPIGWTTWWSDPPASCFPAEGTAICGTLFDGTALFEPRTPDGVLALDPEVGYEQQKFLVSETLLWLPENNKTQWLDMLRIYQMGYDANPGIDNRIELHDPDGKVWVARRFGTEVIFGKTVQRGVAARILEWANSLLVQAYQTTPVDYDTDGTVDWYEVVRDGNGDPVVLFDPGMSYLDTGGNPGAPPVDCNSSTNVGCLCEDNRGCVRLKQYLSVPQFLWQAVRDFGIYDPDLKGVWE